MLPVGGKTMGRQSLLGRSESLSLSLLAYMLGTYVPVTTASETCTWSIDNSFMSHAQKLS